MEIEDLPSNTIPIFVRSRDELIYEFFDPYGSGMFRVIRMVIEWRDGFTKLYCWHIWFDRNNIGEDPDRYACDFPNPLVALHNALDVLRERAMTTAGGQ